jgi:4-amino-4-deoxy-L-arabinose transferase
MPYGGKILFSSLGRQAVWPSIPGISISSIKKKRKGIDMKELLLLRCSRLHLAGITMLAFLVAFSFQGSRGLYESTEGRYAECSREMLAAGSFHEPMLDSQPHWTKPPMTYWAIIGGMSLLGQNEWGVRAYLAVAFVLTVISIHFLGKLMWGNEVAPFCALTYATSPFPVAAANSVTSDTLLTFWVVLSMLTFWAGVRTRSRFWFSLMWLALGCAFLTKGPPAILPLLAIIPVFLLIRTNDPALPSIFPLAGLGLFALTGLTWYFFEALQHPGLLHYWLKDEVVGRVVTNEFRRNPEWYKAITLYWPLLLFGGFPWLALIAVKWKGIITSLQISPFQRAYWNGRKGWIFVLLSISLPLMLFSLSKSKQPLYVLPLFTPVALLLGKCVHRLVCCGQTSIRTVNRIAVVTALVLIAGKCAMAYIPSSKDLSGLAGKITAMSKLTSHRHLYLVTDKPMHGLQFYMNGQITKASFSPDSRVFTSPSELTRLMSQDCLHGITPVLLLEKRYVEGASAVRQTPWKTYASVQEESLSDRYAPAQLDSKSEQTENIDEPQQKTPLDIIPVYKNWVAATENGCCNQLSGLLHAVGDYSSMEDIRNKDVKRFARLLGSPEFCAGNKYRLSLSKEKTPPAQQPDRQ